MLTVNLITKNKNTVVQEETFECVRVRSITTGMKGRSDEEIPGLLFEYDEDSARHVSPRDDGLWYDCFVMNEAGTTINRHAL